MTEISLVSRSYLENVDFNIVQTLGVFTRMLISASVDEINSCDVAVLLHVC